MGDHHTITITVELPREHVVAGEAGTLSAELRALWAVEPVEQVRLKRIGVGKGAELSGLSRSAFMRLLGAHGVPVIDHAVDDLLTELASAGSSSPMLAR